MISVVAVWQRREIVVMRQSCYLYVSGVVFVSTPAVAASVKVREDNSQSESNVTLPVAHIDIASLYSKTKYNGQIFTG